MSFVLIILSSIAFAWSLSNGVSTGLESCVEFQLADNYGAGWGTATLQITIDHGSGITQESYAPDITHNPLSVKYCNGASNLEITTSRRLFSEEVAPAKALTVSIQGKTDAYTGALVWKAIDLQTNEVLLGNSQSTMVLELNVKDDLAFIILQSSENVVRLSSDTSLSCTSCITAAKFDTLNEADGLFNKNQIVSTAVVYSSSTSSSSSSLSSNTITSLSSSNAAATTSTTDASANAGSSDTYLASSDSSDMSRRKLLSNIYLDGKDNTWFSSDGYGTTYEILDVTGSKQFYAGQLCAGSSASACDVALPAGQYVWRVNGALDPNKDDVAWQYCGAHGGASTELEFTIDASGNCVPEGWKSASSGVTDSYMAPEKKSAYVLEGSFLLTRTSSDDGSVFSDTSLDILKSSLAMESVGTHQAMVMLDNGVSIMSYQDVSFGSAASASADNSGATTSSDTAVATDADTKQFLFRVEFSANEFDSLRGDSATVQEVVAMLRQNLRESMDSGSFVSDVIQKASYESDTSLQYVSSSQLLKLSLISETYSSQELLRVVDEGFSILADGVVLSGCIFGVVLGVWLRQYLKRRAEQREFEIDLSRSSVSITTSLPRSLHGTEQIHQSMRPSTVPDVEQIQ